MNQIGMGDLFRHIHDRHANGRTELERVERLELLGKAIAMTQKARALVKEQGLLLTVLIKELKAEVETLK